MITKIILLSTFLIIGFKGLDIIAAQLINLSIKFIFRISEDFKPSTFWIGHIIVITFIFTIWILFTKEHPSFFLVWAMAAPNIYRLVTAELTIIARPSKNFLINLGLIYIIGTKLGYINFILW